MVKKIVLGGLLIGLIAFLVTGAVIRTNAISGSEESSGRHGAEVADAVLAGQGGNGGSGRWATEDATGLRPESGANTLARGGNGGPGGNGGGEDAAERQPLADVEPADWITYAGTVVGAADDLVEVETATGEIIPFEGRPLSYALEQGFTLEMGDSVLLHGFDEDGEFKLGAVKNLGTGASVTLRDASGQPAWAGRGRRQ